MLPHPRRIRQSGRGASARAGSSPSAVAHDLLHDLAQVVVGLVDLALALGARAVAQEVLDPRELRLGPELLGVRAQAVEQALRRGRARSRGRTREVHERGVEPVARGEPLVLVEHLPRVVRQLRRRRRSARTAP